MNILLIHLLGIIILITVSECDSCIRLGQFLLNLKDTVGSEIVSPALVKHPSFSRFDYELANCSKEDTCCSIHSEKLLRRTATDLFSTASFSMLLTQLGDQVSDIQDKITRDIYEVTKSADGEAAANSSFSYILHNNINLDSIVTHRLVNFVYRVYGQQWNLNCFDKFSRTRDHVSKRVIVLLSKYQQVYDGLGDGVRLVKRVKQLIVNSLSESCKVALNRASLFENMGCKMCLDRTYNIKTCYQLCTSVAKGCMRPLLCYIGDWNAWVKRQDQITLELLQISNRRLGYVDTLKQMYDQEYQEVADVAFDGVNCPPGTSPSIAAMNTLQTVSVNLPSVTKEMYEDNFGPWLSRLPDSFCAMSRGVSNVRHGRVDTDCWNGTHKGMYIKPITLFDLEDQKCNPEVVAEPLPCDNATKSMQCGWFNHYDITQSTIAPITTTYHVHTSDQVEGSRSSVMRLGVGVTLRVQLLLLSYAFLIN